MSRSPGTRVLCAAIAVASGLGCAKASRESRRETSWDNFAPSSSAGTSASTGTDPGPRGGEVAAGTPFSTLNDAERALFASALAVFKEVASVSGTIANEPGVGLGPTFNGNSCAFCHAEPAVGGSSPGLRSPQKPVPNPQIALATLHGATNTVPSFIKPDGPVREARFVTAPHQEDAPLDGDVYSLFTIKGRRDAPGCNLAQPDFVTQLANHNVTFRIPSGIFGLGLVENTPDAVLRVNLDANRSAKSRLGITGRFNTSSNDGTVSKFGWKAQNKSLMMFSAEAYNVEEGVSNESFTNERGAIQGCVFNTTPEDRTTNTGGSADIVSAAIFMRLTAPPEPAPRSPSAERGSALFDSVGCALCHSRSLRTTASPYTGMSNVTFHPFSDFALHHMGAALADGVKQGTATGDEFRTAPLWGVGQRLFFLHDGRTSDLGAAIEAHAAPGKVCTFKEHEEAAFRRAVAPSEPCASEANAVIGNYNALGPKEQSDLIAFLRSL